MKRISMICLMCLFCSQVKAIGDWISADTIITDHSCVFTVYKTIVVPEVPAGHTFALAGASEDPKTIVFVDHPGFSLRVPDRATFSGMINAPIFGFGSYKVKSFLGPDKYINVRGAISEEGAVYEIGQYVDPNKSNMEITEIWAGRVGDWDHGALIMKLRTATLGLSFIPQELFARNHMIGIIAYCGMPSFSSLVIIDPKAFVVRKYTNFSQYQLLSDQKTLWSKPPYTRVDERAPGFDLEKLKETKEQLMPALSAKYDFADNDVGSVEIIYPKH